MNCAKPSKATDILEKDYKWPLAMEQKLSERPLTPLPYPSPSSTVHLLAPLLVYTSWQGLIEGRVPLFKKTLHQRSGLWEMGWSSGCWDLRVGWGLANTSLFHPPFEAKGEIDTRNSKSPFVVVCFQDRVWLACNSLSSCFSLSKCRDYRQTATRTVSSRITPLFLMKARLRIQSRCMIQKRFQILHTDTPALLVSLGTKLTF